jgi:hypothetical protein
MPTVNPRVQVTLSPSLFDLVGAMARAQRVSRSQVLRELLEAAEPALQRVVKMMDAAERAKGAVKAGFAEQLLRSQQVLEGELAAQLSLVDGVSTDLVTLAERIEGRRPGRPRGSADGAGGAPGAGNPPASNRGVKSVKTTKDATTPQPSLRGSSPKGRHPKGGVQ